MSLKILTSTLIDLKELLNKSISFKNTDHDTIALMKKNKPAMYLLSPKRLSKLLKIELKYLKKNKKSCRSKKKLFKAMDDNINYNEKFRMHKSWYPGKDFIQLSSLWGINITYEVTQEELQSFISYWQVENKICYHVQWQQKLARNIQLNRTQKIFNKKKFLSQDINYIPQPNNKIPYGFKG